MRALAAALAALLMIRNADDDCLVDGLPTIPAAARSAIDAAILGAKAELLDVYPNPGDGKPRAAVTWPEVDRRKADAERRRLFARSV